MRGTDDFLLVLAGVVVVEKPEEFVELQGDLGLELDGFGGLSLESASPFGTLPPLFWLSGQHW
jgi:hypothetical protein